MESSAKRRLESISRHLIPSLEPNPPSGLLHSSVLSAGTGSWERAPVVIGGMVLDIQAIPSAAEPGPGTTTPGKVRYVNGGVARNIAECMSKFGAKPFLISVVGTDMAGEQLMKFWKSARLPTDEQEAFLTPGWIERFHQTIKHAPVVMVDANLPSETLEFACRMAATAGVPVWFEPVSVIKSSRIAAISKFVTFTSPNEAELISMANVLSPHTKFEDINLEEIKEMRIPVEDIFQMLKPAIVSLLDNGIKLLLITLGSNGLFLCHSRNLDLLTKNFISNSIADGFLTQLYQEVNGIYYNGFLAKGSSEYCAFHFPAIPAEVISVVGAGDCLVGGTLAGICAGLDVERSVSVGVVAAKAAVESESNVPDKFFMTNIRDGAKKVLSCVKPLLL